MKRVYHKHSDFSASGILKHTLRVHPGNVLGVHRGVSGFYDPAIRPSSFFKAYRAVAKRRSAYAAMPVWGYRGVTSGLTSEAHEVSRY